MKIILHQVIELQNTSNTKCLAKEIKSDFIPRLGDTIIDWIYCYPDHEKEDYKVIEVAIDYSESVVHIYIERMHLEHKGVFDKIDELLNFKKDDWKIT